MSEATQAMLIPAGARRQREEEAAAVASVRVTPIDTTQKYPMSQWIKTGHEWAKAKDGTITGKCLHQGCNVDAGDSTIDRNCVGNKRFKIEGGQITTTTHDGCGVYVKLV